MRHHCSRDHYCFQTIRFEGSCSRTTAGIYQLFSKVILPRVYDTYTSFCFLLESFQGTNVKQAKALILDSKLKVISVDDFAQAAEASVKLALIMNLAKSLDLDANFSAKASKREEDCKKGEK